MQPKGRKRRPKQEELLTMVERFHQFLRQCQQCQAEAAPHWQYCATCGIRLATACPGCGSPLPPAGARFCPHCGVEIPKGDD